MRRWKKIRDALRALAEQANKQFPDLNSGGCAVFAVMVADALRAQGINARIAVAMYHPPGLSMFSARHNAKHGGNNPPEMEDYNASDIYFNHVAVSFIINGRRWIYETTGGLQRRTRHTHVMGMSLVPGSLSVDEVRPIAFSPWGWNDQFDRDDIPLVQELIADYLPA